MNLETYKYVGRWIRHRWRKQEKHGEKEVVISLAGNPNVGKSTLFNSLTGLKQHTGNWAGKTVEHATGSYTYQGQKCKVVDLPGTYSLLSRSREEEIARDFICFGNADITVVVCDATCLERNLNLVLQILEITNRVVVCVNLMDEARERGIEIDLEALEQEIGVPVIGTVAKKKKSLLPLKELVQHPQLCAMEEGETAVVYSEDLEIALNEIESVLLDVPVWGVSTRFIALRLLEGNESFLSSFHKYAGISLYVEKEIQQALNQVEKRLVERGMNKDCIQEEIVEKIIHKTEKIKKSVVKQIETKAVQRQKNLDKILTNKRTGIPIMMLLLCFILWITIEGANIPSQILWEIGIFIQKQVSHLLVTFLVPSWIQGVLVDGVLKVLLWVVSVMLPPMAIFFPLFTLLEDLGYLPRVAFNLDHHFKKACACGKQSLTMCMGIGCNAAGVIGCRIIDSPRERLIAILTNNFVPCNGRLPILISMISIFAIGNATGIRSSISSAFLLSGVILIGIFLTFVTSKVLSKTILKGEPSSFTLELPPYRKPQILDLLVRSVFERTLKVLGRAVMVAAPMGFVIWILANITVGDMTLLARGVNFLEPFGRLIGLDGVILLAFLLGMPANEIVVPIMVMTYLAQGTLVEVSDLNFLKELLVSNGWSWVTAVNMVIFTLMHWPCSTTLLTIKKETGSYKWTVLAFLLPTVIGMVLCFFFTNILRVLGLF